jgi:hypothetical protein
MNVRQAALEGGVGHVRLVQPIDGQKKHMLEGSSIQQVAIFE